MNRTEAPVGTTQAEAREMIDVARATLRRNVGSDGVGCAGAVDPTEVARAADYLKSVGGPTGTRRWIDSYKTKHLVEAHFSKLGAALYISNGAAITAAVGLGIPWRPIPLRDRKNVELRLRRVRRRAGKGAS